MSKESYMIGPSGDGEYYVDFNNKCKVCRRRMPLPEMEGKYCPNCGTYEPFFSEIRNIALKLGQTTIPICSSCGANSGPNDHFCIECGYKLNPRKSISLDIPANSTAIIPKNYRDILIANAMEVLEQCNLLNFEENGECGFEGNIVRITENIKHPMDTIKRIIDNLFNVKYSELV